MLSPDVWAQVQAAAPLAGKYAAVFLVAYCVLVSVYRIYFHPLKDYPGPMLAKVTDLYGVYFAIQKRLHQKTFQNFKTYGPVVRQGPNRLVFSSAAAAQDIYQSSDVTKSNAYNALVTMPPTTSVFDSLSKSVHRVKRQRIAPLLSAKSMRNFEPQMQEQIHIYLRKLLESSRKTPGASIDMKKRTRDLTLTVITLLAFGHDLELQTKDTHSCLPDLLQSTSWRFNLYFQAPWTRFLFVELLVQVYNWFQGGTLIGTVLTLIRRRMSEGKHAKPDLYSHMMKQLDAAGSDDGFSLREVWAEAILFVIAGSETSSTTMSSTLFYLAISPDCKKKLLQELQAAFKSGRDIQAGPELFGCVYLRACIDEAMRIAPPAPGVLWRQRSTGPDAPNSGEPWIVDGHVVPIGTHVGASTYTLHLNEEYFPDPWTYKPERWLSPDGKDDATSSEANRAAFIPFSLGERGCAGKALAVQEIYLTVAKTLWYFDFELAAESLAKGKVFEILDTISPVHDGPFMHFHPRGELWKELVEEN